MQEKQCALCGEIKLIGGYYRWASGKPYAHCKQCHQPTAFPPKVAAFCRLARRFYANL